jgi:hypothetical protein
MPLVNVRIAARLTGRDRSTITRAIESGRLSAGRDERGRYQIDPAELERAFGSLRSPDARTDALHEDLALTHDAIPRNACAREVELLREMLERERSERERERSAWEEERIFLRSLVERQSDQLKLLTDQREKEQEEAPRRRWWRWRRAE